MVLVADWSDDCFTLETGGWHSSFLPSGLRLAPGIYYLKAVAEKDGTVSTAEATCMILP
jgi:hypothetical protein